MRAKKKEERSIAADVRAKAAETRAEAEAESKKVAEETKKLLVEAKLLFDEYYRKLLVEEVIRKEQFVGGRKQDNWPSDALQSAWPSGGTLDRCNTTDSFEQFLVTHLTPYLPMQWVRSLTIISDKRNLSGRTSRSSPKTILLIGEHHDVHDEPCASILSTLKNLFQVNKYCNKFPIDFFIERRDHTKEAIKHFRPNLNYQQIQNIWGVYDECFPREKGKEKDKYDKTPPYCDSENIHYHWTDIHYNTTCWQN